MARFPGKLKDLDSKIDFCQSGARVGGLARALARIASAGRWAGMALNPLGSIPARENRSQKGRTGRYREWLEVPLLTDR